MKYPVIDLETVRPFYGNLKLTYGHAMPGVSPFETGLRLTVFAKPVDQEHWHVTQVGIYHPSVDGLIIPKDYYDEDAQMWGWLPVHYIDRTRDRFYRDMWEDDRSRGHPPIEFEYDTYEGIPIHERTKGTEEILRGLRPLN